MSVRFKIIFVLPVLFLLSFCGSKPTLQLNLAGTAAFGDATVTDIVFTIQNVATSAGTLDQDGDGTPDSFVYPNDCGAAKPAGCGFPLQHGQQITVGDLPLNFRYIVLVELRNSTGVVVHNGQATFDNQESSGAVAVNVN